MIERETTLLVMARKDRETGAEILQLLMHEFFGDLQVSAIQEALGLSGSKSSSYYSRIKQDDYPNAEEIDKIAAGLDLENRIGLTAGELKIRFGAVDPNDIPKLKREVEDMEAYLRSEDHPTKLATRKGVKRPKIRFRDARPDAPPM